MRSFSRKLRVTNKRYGSCVLTYLESTNVAGTAFLVSVSMSGIWGFKPYSFGLEPYSFGFELYSFGFEP